MTHLMVFISDFKAQARVGAPDWERAYPQTLTFHIELIPTTSQSCESDALQDTIDYASIVSLFKETLANKEFYLLEALASHLCDLVLTKFSCQKIKIKVHKTQIILGVQETGVVVEKAKDEITN